MKAVWRPEPTGRGGWRLVDQYGIVLKRYSERQGIRVWVTWPFKDLEAAQRRADRLNNAPVEEKL